MHKMDELENTPAIDLISDQFFMKEALRQAVKALEVDEVPIGAVIVHKQKIIARAYNQVEVLKDATAHAEILAITQASSILNDWRLENCTIYVTKEPCPMCAGALVLSRIQRLVFGAFDLKSGGAGGVFNITANSQLNHRIETLGGILEEDCAILLKNFFSTKRNLIL